MVYFSHYMLPMDVPTDLYRSERDVNDFSFYGKPMQNYFVRSLLLHKHENSLILFPLINYFLYGLCEFGYEHPLHWKVSLFFCGFFPQYVELQLTA